MEISVRVLADSRNTATGGRVVTMLLKYPRFVHAELLTHRVFSRNAASSRAIPAKTMIQRVRDDPAAPAEWYRDSKGMASRDRLDGPELGRARGEWDAARQDALWHAEQLRSVGVHKSLVNRLLEPFQVYECLVTSTQWRGFIAQRVSPHAMPELRVLAEAIQEQLEVHDPQDVEPGGWHIPFGDQMPEVAHRNVQLKIAVARCARLSYQTQFGDHSVEADLALFDRLKEQGHWSPFEHVAVATASVARVRNFTGGWVQLRAMLDRNEMEG